VHAFLEELMQTQSHTTNRRALIIGSGIAGPAVALFLKRAGLEPVICEARSAAAEDEGLWLNLATNGLEILKTLGVLPQVIAQGAPTSGFLICKCNGHPLAMMKFDPPAGMAVASITIGRGALHKILRAAAIHEGIPIHFGKRLKAASVIGSNTALATFDDGTDATGDVLIGCDGIRSRVRGSLFPEVPAPRYSGTIGYGGFSHNTAHLPCDNVMHMVRGKRAYFLYQVLPSGEVGWGDHVQHPHEPQRDELSAIPQAELRQRLLDLHGDDAQEVQEIVRAVVGDIRTIAIYDLPYVQQWHTGPVCLIGDAAHAMSPHAGQGAATSLEDAAVLAQCLRDIPDVERAFHTFQQLRYERVHKIMETARRNGKNHFSSSPFSEWLQGVMMPIFFKLFAHANDWMYAYTVDWNAKVVAA
jgi:2-polyprenyl-6-methoxyphenol hydroxylase-like FAD-dependent oxidoreductase